MSTVYLFPLYTYIYIYMCTFFFFSFESMEHSALSQAFKIAPVHEYLLQGSIVDSSKDVLLHRLRGLCDNAENQPEVFTDHEMVFQLSKYM